MVTLFRQPIENDLIVEDEVIVYDVVKGNIIVKNKGTLVLDGVCEKIIVIEEGGIARISGTAKGYVFNLGGKLLLDDNAIAQKAYHIYGVSHGNVYYVAHESGVDADGSGR